MEKIKSFFSNLRANFIPALKSSKAKSLYASLICIAVGLLIGLIFMICVSPGDAFLEFPSLISGGLSVLPKAKVFFSILEKTAPLIVCGLGISFAYKTGIFNIGGAGQYVMGAFGSLLSTLVFGWPWFLSILMGILFGAIWGGLVAVLKIFFNVNEVLSGIMLNWISLFFVNYSFNTYLKSSCVDTTLGNKTYALSEAQMIPSIGDATASLSISIFIALIFAIAIFVILNYTKLGYELKATGLNKDATRYAGMNDKKNAIVTMAISGGLAGLGGALYFISGQEQWNIGNSSALPSMPWNGIVVAFIAQNNPIGIIFASLFTSMLSSGGKYLTQTIYPAEIANLITGIIVYASGLTAIIKILIDKIIINRKKNGKKMKKEIEKDANKEELVKKGGNE